MQGVHTGFRTEAHHTQKYRHLNQGGVTGGLFGVQGAAGNKVQAVAVAAQEEDAAQCQKGTGHGIEQVLERTPHGFLGAVVEHQGHTQQGNHFKEQVHGDEVPREIHAHQRCQGQQEEGEEFVIVFFVVQVLIGVNPHQQEAEGGNGHKELAHLIYPQGDGEAVGHGKQHALPLRGEQHDKGQHGFQSQSDGGYQVFVLLAFHQGQQDSRQRGEQNHKEHH